MKPEATLSNDTLARLAAVIATRRAGDPDKSYVARLFAKGEDAIIVPAVSDEDAKKLFPKGWKTVLPYLRTVSADIFVGRSSQGDPC